MKTTKTLIVALALSALPGLAFATCSFGTHQEASMSCAEGTVWDAETEKCVTASS